MVNWLKHKKHREQVIKDEGFWIGLLNENGEPLMDLPKILNGKIDNKIMDHGDLDITIDIETGFEGNVHLISDYLIANDLGLQDDNGLLTPSNVPTRFISIETEDHNRKTYMVAYCVANGDFDRPTSIQILGVGLTDLLASLPCPSDLKSWRETEFHNLDRDWVKPFNVNRDLAEITLANTADGYSVSGEAITTIRKLIKDSINTVNTAMDWEESHLVVNEEKVEKTEENVIIRITDDDVWTTVKDYARYAGLNIEVKMYFPGDGSINNKEYNRPIGIVEVYNHKE